MGTLLNEQQFIEGNAVKVGERMSTQLNRYTDKRTTFVTYYHLNANGSTINDGFEHVERIIGKNSPLRYNIIHDVPILDIDPIVFSLNDEEQGLDMDYEGDALMLPDVIEPLQNDFFIINHLGKEFLFMITGIELDTVKAHNYYRINFTLYSLDKEDDIDRQVIENYDCVYENIGSDDRCIIQSDTYKLIQSLNEMYFRITNAYEMYFYNKKTNVFVFGQDDVYITYDSYVNKFITDNKLFAKKNDMKVIYTEKQDYEPRFEQRYERSIFNAVMRKNARWAVNRKYWLDVHGMKQSIFEYFNMKNVAATRLDKGDHPNCRDYISHELFLAISSSDGLDKIAKEKEELEKKELLKDMSWSFTPKDGEIITPNHEPPKKEINEEITRLDMNEYILQLFNRYFYDENLSISNMDLDRLYKEEFDFINEKDESSYRLLPVLLYILKSIYKKELRVSDSKPLL